jgi:hypothetical protein
LVRRKIGSGHSLQNFSNSLTNGFQASKKASQLETRIATEPENLSSLGMEESAALGESLGKVFTGREIYKAAQTLRSVNVIRERKMRLRLCGRAIGL